MNFLENKGLEMQQNELKVWFENLKNGIKDETIIILNKNINISNSNVKSIGYYSNIDNLKNGNTIIVGNKTLLEYKDSDKFFKSIFKNLIIIVKHEKSIENFLNLLENNDDQNEIDIEYSVVKKKDFSELLKMDAKELGDFLENNHFHIHSFYDNLPMYDLNFINTSINILTKQNILTASFANYLYKFAYLDFTSNTTNVGKQIRKILGIKSKTINNIRTIDITFPKGKPFKGYDLNTDRYLEIKKKIAQKLVNLNDKKLDLDKIAEITELPIKEVKKLFNI